MTPASATNPVGASNTVTCAVSVGGVPQSGVTVNFAIRTGPNAGQTGTDDTDGSGRATFTYTSNGQTGTDTILASGVIESRVLLPFDCEATKTWVEPCVITCPTDIVAAATSPAGAVATFMATATGNCGSAPLTCAGR